jgi:(R)-2-hydroxyacyl-CoA dehydratese activating ATPase
MPEYFAGIDIGSTMTKAVIISDTIAASFVSVSGPEHRRLAHKVFGDLLHKAALLENDICYVVATGYGRVNVPFADKQITEISCHAKAVSSLMPSVHTVIDIGGQDCKAIKVLDGKVVDFVMNDKCAAGTGRFIEVIAESLGVKLADVGRLSLSGNEVTISNTCTVFAEREVVANLAEGASVADLLAGVHTAIATRISSMANRLKIEKDVAVSGGGAKNIGLVKALEKRLNLPLLIPDEPLLMGAIGAAMLGKDVYIKAKQNGVPIKRKEYNI